MSKLNFSGMAKIVITIFSNKNIISQEILRYLWNLMSSVGVVLLY